MTTTDGGLVRIIMLAPKRRVEMAVPEHVPVVGLLPTLLRHGGPTLAEDGVERGGWVLRRLDGSALEPDRSMAALGVHDGEMLVLAPRDQEWPEPAYDDVAEAIAATAQRLGARWNAQATRATGLAAAGVALALGLLLVWVTPADKHIAGYAALATAVVLLGAAAFLSRTAAADRATAVLLAGFGTLYAAVGGAAAPALRPLADGITAWQVVSGAAALVCAGIAGRFAVTGHGRYSIAAVVFAVGGGAMGFLATVQETATAGAAAIVGGALAMSLFALPRLAMNQGGVPAPPIPSLTGAEEPMPVAAQLSQAVQRSDELLAGLLLGIGACIALSVWLLVLTPSTGATYLAAAIVALCALRARAFAAVRHRVPLLCAAAAGAAALGWLGWTGVAAADRPVALIPALAVVLVVAGAVAAAGSRVSRRAPSPHFGRAGDIADTLVTIAVPILVALVLGLFGVMRGIWES
ncbi:type VII secretion integral membrane protein EccD [Allocatelliglobosispora scoriae]|uniref:Type VII secretion integral membrane protein EccD n=1 Tax=Allocatelliglobosispora scoriae TaxID=643052 RepID=A0A841BK16_9ACTN|nr:type VII secretion integral membrane protein EccD [Allocatelliglobosispora scoriae]MBB5867556.1 type VII secretion integral membrane protein EccD [Allocatelliglobosispora scoriae]